MENKTTRFISRDSAGTVEFINRALDILSCLIAAWVISMLLPIEAKNFRDWGLLVFVALCSMMLSFQHAELYRSWRGRPYSDQFSRLLLAWLYAGLVVAGVWLVFSMSEVVPGNWLMYWLVLSALVTSLFRAAVFVTVRHLRRKGVNQKFVIVYGAGSLGKSIASQVERSPESGFQVLGFLDDDHSLQGKNFECAKVLGGFETLDQTLGDKEIDELWVALPLHGTQRVTHILKIAEQHMVSVRLFPDLYGLTLLNHSVTELLGFPIIDLNVDRMQGANRFVKELEDRVLGFVFFIISLPLIGVIALLIKKTSHGPVLFKQRRNGWDGRPFTIYKFRTMRLHAEPEGHLTQAKRDDNRFTTIGRWLRRTSLDELPQLFNVLQGRMSLVGPRPHAIEHDQFFGQQIQGYIRRNRVKPGITGWAQINDLRGEVKDIEEMARRVKHDLYYIEHWSLWFDLRIILATILKIFFSKKAW